MDEVEMDALFQTIFAVVVPGRVDKEQRSSSLISPPSSSHLAVGRHSFRDEVTNEGATATTSNNRAEVVDRAGGKSILDVVVRKGSRSPAFDAPIPAEHQ